VSKHTHWRWQLDKGSWISNDVKDENRSVWVLESDYLNMKESLEAENARLKAEVKKLTEAGNAMDNAISEIDPQRAERHRFMRMTDAEYLAVMKWRVTKDPNYNRA
jgi:hypothetical protein